jgi:hypothetical protein
MKLLVDPFIDPDLEYVIKVAGTRTEGQTIECVDGSLFVRKRGQGLLLGGGFLRRKRRQARNRAQSQNKNWEFIDMFSHGKPPLWQNPP